MAISRISDVIRNVLHAVGEAGDATPLPIGKQYLNEGVGGSPRAVFVLQERGRLGPAPDINAGYVAGWTRACTVYVRGAEDGSDVGREDSAEILADRIINALKWAAPGEDHAVRLVDAKPEGPTDADAYGFEVVFTFTYTRGVPLDKAIYRAMVTPAPATDRDRPNGDTGYTFEQRVTMQHTGRG
jgi:hypothetical protein